MKRIAACCLHYGKEYFETAIKSVIGYVDEVVIVYTDKPSHGHGTKLKCPDSRQELKTIADKYGCTWIDYQGGRAENIHRKQYIDYARRKGYDQILVFDSDEIFIRPDLMLDEASKHDAFNIGISGDRWTTFYRSFNDYVTDGFAPVRVHNLRKPLKQVNISEGHIYHMGYCISNALMNYKISCHGHKDDFQSNSGWYHNKWVNYSRKTKYLHPATNAYWINTEVVDKDVLPQILKDHPNFSKDKVE